jgi:predicted Fe-Mo cluster-binding NifX family protein
MSERISMRLCIPVDENAGLKSATCAHFGSAPYFLIHDTETGACEVIDNSGRDHLHGMCQPLSALEGQTIDAVVCVGMGPRALERLLAAGIKTYRSVGATVEEVVKACKAGELELLTPETACRDHGCG